MLSTLAACLLLNDTSFSARSGNPKPMTDATEIQMVSASIKGKVPSCEVTTEYKFINLGSKRTALMGFPEEGYDAYLEDGRKTWFKKFESWVDGKPVKALAEKIEDKDAQEFGYRIWWLKYVEFGKGQTRTVKNRYISDHGSDTTPRNFFQYIVRTASTWKGPIKSIRVEMDCSGFPSGMLYTCTPAPHKKNGDTLLWYWENIEPTENHDIEVAWLPDLASLPDSINPDTLLGERVYRRP